MTESTLQESSSPIKPTTKSERIPELDALRGFALLGILLMNIEYFTNSSYSLLLGNSSDYSGINLFADRFTLIFIEGKFWVMFAMLFGMGFAVIQTRMQNTGRSFGRFYLKRMIVLMVFGALHGIFIWTGDILFSYAFAGMVLLLFRKTKISRLWKYSLFFFFLLILLFLSSGVPDPKAPVDEFTTYLQTQLELSNQVYPFGSYFEVSKLRFSEFALTASMSMLFFPYFLSVFLFGAFVYKKGILNNLTEHKALLKKVLIIGLPVGLLLAVPSSLAVEKNIDDGYMGALQAISAVIMCLSYVSGFLLLAMNNTFNLRSALAPVGRMALSNYILQSLVFSTLFYGYGLGLWGSVSRAALIPMVVVFFVFQCILSQWWMKSHRFGPLEWVWRKLTYGKI